MRLLPSFNMLVGVLNHDDGRINHGAHGNCNAAETHDVGVKPLKVHRYEGECETERQCDHRHQCTAHMPQEDGADERNDDEFFNKLMREVLDGTVNE